MTTSSKPVVHNSQGNTVARPSNGQLVSSAVAKANNGLAASLEQSAKARIKYVQ